MNFMQTIQVIGKPVTFDKKQFIFRQGERDNFIYLITNGAVKASYVSESGKEFIKSFLFSGDVIASSQALNGGQCSFSVSCLKQSDVLKVSYQTLLAETQKNIECANGVIELLMAFAMKKEQREFELLCWSAEQRYQALLEKVPTIRNYVTQNDMAKYLGITPVALSRIKHQAQ